MTVKKLTQKQVDKILEELGTPSTVQKAVAPAGPGTFWGKNWPVIKVLLVLVKSTFGLFKGKAWKAGIDAVIANGDAFYNGFATEEDGL